MKLIAMKLRGIGPYRDEYCIDFTALTRSHMFLIDGETGAGKTTILDCLTFALYGTVLSNGDPAYQQRLRSRFLENDRMESYVDLIFESGGRYYEVRRSPNYQQISLNGTGTTRHGAKGKLVRIEEGMAELLRDAANDGERFFAFAQRPGNGHEIVSRASEVGPEIERLIGLNRDQFSKTIVLAQGQFAEFLRMKAEDRTNLVKDLFAAQRYEDIQNELDRRRSEARRLLEKRREALKGRITAAKDAAARIGPEPGDGADDARRWGLNDDGDPDVPARDSADILSCLEDTVEAMRLTGKATLETCERQCLQTSDELAAASERYEGISGMKQAANREEQDSLVLAELRSRRPEIDASEERLQRDAKAAPVAEIRDRLADLKAKRDAQSEVQKAIEDELDGMPSTDGLRGEYAIAVAAAARREEAKARLAAADEHRRLLDEAEQRRKNLDEARTALQEARTVADAANRTLAELPEERELTDGIADAMGRLGARQSNEDRLERLTGMAVHARKLKEDEEQLSADQRDEQSALNALHDARTALEEAERAVMLSGAARYAMELTEGMACPVCGSMEHPSPAELPDNVPDGHAIETLRNTVDKQTLLRDEAERRRRETESIISIERNLSEGRNIEELEHLIAEATTALDELDRLQGRLDELKDMQRRVREATERSAAAREDLTRKSERASAAGNAYDSACRAAEAYDDESVNREREDAERTLREAERQAALVEQIQRRMTRREELEKQEAQAKTISRHLEDDIAVTETTMRQTLQASGFVSMEEAEAVMLDDAQRKRLRDETERYRESVTEAETNLARSRAEVLKALVIDDHGCGGAYDNSGNPTALGEAIMAIDLNAAQELVNAKEAEADAANERRGAMREAIRHWNEASDQLLEEATEWDKAERAFIPLQRMALLAKADQRSPAERKTSLITYAVTERFRDVLDRANELLRDIHGGIYELRLGEDAVRTGGKIGLPILVLDRRNELLREPGTLSGGETFFVSLALALALADVIQAENGGIAMDTLFVDEGFGTLSDEYLADVLDVLRRIARTRDVGVISHVGQLKEQIAERITVTRVRPDGESRLEVMA